MVVAGVLEFLLGNTFPFVVSCGFGMYPLYSLGTTLTDRALIGGFWLTMGASNTPGFGAYAAYSPDQDNPMLGLSTPGFLASFGMSSPNAITLVYSYLSHLRYAKHSFSSVWPSSPSSA
jgi:hypothetical protein